MTYQDYAERVASCHPRMLWTKIHKYTGYALFGAFCFSAGFLNSTIYYRITHLWHVAGAETAGKVSEPVPACVPIKPPAQPSQ